jgi:hypothetical protein
MNRDATQDIKYDDFKNYDAVYWVYIDERLVCNVLCPNLKCCKFNQEVEKCIDFHQSEVLLALL